MIASGVCQGCVVARGALATGMDWALERLVGRGMNGVTFGQYTFTDLDYANDVCPYQAAETYCSSSTDLTGRS